MPNPNILFIMADQMKATASHLYGNAFCETPSLERLAREGVLYQNAFTPHALCVPARISVWTGRFPHSHGGRRKMVRTRDWKYVHDPMGDKDELYDLRKDPWELDNRIDDPTTRGVIDGLARHLLDWSIRTEDVGPVPLPDYGSG